MDTDSPEETSAIICVNLWFQDTLQENRVLVLNPPSMWITMWKQVLMRLIGLMNKTGGEMKTIQMTIDEKLLQEVDSLVDKLGTTRSAFIRETLKQAIRHQRIAELERKYAEEYAREPVDLEEIRLWDGERAWGADDEER